MNVDFPEPEGPTMKTNSPFSISIDTPFRAREPVLYSLTMSTVRITPYRVANRQPADAAIRS